MSKKSSICSNGLRHPFERLVHPFRKICIRSSSLVIHSQKSSICSNGLRHLFRKIVHPFVRLWHPFIKICIYSNPFEDRDEPNNRQGAVYKIKCSDCQASYIGETGRNLNTRLTEHKRATRNVDVNNHIAVNHQLTNHNIDWDTAQCLTYSTNYFQRLTLESWYTNIEQTPLNRCQQLPAPYKQLIHDANKTDKRTSNRPT